MQITESDRERLAQEQKYENQIATLKATNLNLVSRTQQQYLEICELKAKLSQVTSEEIQSIMSHSTSKIQTVETPLVKDWQDATMDMMLID